MRPSRLQHCWDWPESWEESWRSEETCCHSDSSGRPPANAVLQKKKIIIIIKNYISNNNTDKWYQIIIIILNKDKNITTFKVWTLNTINKQPELTVSAADKNIDIIWIEKHRTRTKIPWYW